MASDKKKSEEKPKEEQTVYEFDKIIHPAGEKQARRLQLTKDDLDPRKDKVLKPLFDLFEKEEFKPYMQMPSIRGLSNYVHSNLNSITVDFQNYKKRGRI